MTTHERAEKMLIERLGIELRYSANPSKSKEVVRLGFPALEDSIWVLGGAGLALWSEAIRAIARKKGK